MKSTEDDAGAVLKVRLPPDVKSRADAVFERKKITQVSAIESLLEWFVRQEDIVQSMILGQIDPDDALLHAAIRRRMKRGKS